MFSLFSFSPSRNLVRELPNAYSALLRDSTE